MNRFATAASLLAARLQHKLTDMVTLFSTVLTLDNSPGAAGRPAVGSKVSTAQPEPRDATVANTGSERGRRTVVRQWTAPSTEPYCPIVDSSWLA